MSIIVAIENKTHRVLAADTRSSSGQGEMNHEPAKKIVQVGESFVGHSGYLLVGNILRDYVMDEKFRHYNPRDEQEVFSFFLDFWKALKERYTLEKQSDTLFVDLNQGFLTISPFGIFETEGDLNTQKISNYAAIGSGAPYAKGYLSTLRIQEDFRERGEIERAATKACFVAAEFNVFCGGMTMIASVKNAIEEREKQP